MNNHIVHTMLQYNECTHRLTPTQTHVHTHIVHVFVSFVCTCSESSDTELALRLLFCPLSFSVVADKEQLASHNSWILQTVPQKAKKTLQKDLAKYQKLTVS